MNKGYYVQMLGFTFLVEDLKPYSLDVFEKFPEKIPKNKKHFYENKSPDKKYFSPRKQDYHNKTIPRNGKNKKTSGVHSQAKSRARRKSIKKGKLEKKCNGKQ